MRRHAILALGALALGGGAGAALGGCGSQTRTVSVSGSPVVTRSTPAPSSATSSTSSAATTSTPTSAATAPASEAGGTTAPSGTTRSAPEPAFTHQENSAAGLSQALSVLQARGYTADDTSQYHPNQTLRVLVGTKSGSGEGYDQQAFFFVGERYIGTDSKEASASVSVLAQGDTEVTLGYALYRSGDPLSNPSGGQATVRFQLDDGQLQALDAIPPAGSSAGLSRR